MFSIDIWWKWVKILFGWHVLRKFSNSRNCSDSTTTLLARELHHSLHWSEDGCIQPKCSIDIRQGASKCSRATHVAFKMPLVTDGDRDSVGFMATPHVTLCVRLHPLTVNYISPYPNNMHQIKHSIVFVRLPGRSSKKRIDPSRWISVGALSDQHVSWRISTRCAMHGSDYNGIPHLYHSMRNELHENAPQRSTS